MQWSSGGEIFYSCGMGINEVIFFPLTGHLCPPSLSLYSLYCLRICAISTNGIQYNFVNLLIWNLG